MENYEEKYKNALLQARQAINNIPDESLVKWLQSIFPELKESEDEKIRKDIISLIKEIHVTDKFYDLNKMLAWIEKQGEQNLTDKVKPKFKVGDWIIGNTIYKVLCVIDDEYRLSLNIDDSIVCAKIKTIDKKFHIWTIQDAKDGDVLATKIDEEPNDFIYIFNKYDQNLGFWSHCYLDAYINRFHEGMYHNNYNVGVPATKEQRDLLFHKMKEAGYEWDVEEKELKKIEQEQTELPNGEDYGIDSLYHAARILEKTLGEVEGYQSDDGILEHKCAIEVVNRLYKQKPFWSEEDEDVINNLLNICAGGGKGLQTICWMFIRRYNKISNLAQIHQR